jgi:putative (di)nucleoside polyphosphate hydrolase
VTFRAGVVGVIRRADGFVLAFERADIPGAWQLPQGGMDPGETPFEAVWREVEEETGLGPDELESVAEFPEWVAYEVPEDRRTKKTGLGQVQRWFLFRARHDEIVPTPDGREFTAWRWVSPNWLVDHVVDFRHAGYARVLGSL